MASQNSNQNGNDVTPATPRAEAAPSQTYVNELEAQREFSDKLVDAVRESLLVLGPDFRVVRANQSFYDHFQVTPDETVGRLVYELGNGQWGIPDLCRLLEEILPQHAEFNDFEVEHEFEQIGRRIMLLNARRIDHVERILLAIEDVTEKVDARRALHQLNETLEGRVEDQAAVLRLIHDVTTTANEARSVNQAFQVTTERICRYNHWFLGHAWRRAGDGSGDMVPTNIWHSEDPDRTRRFRQGTMKKRFAPGQGLIGQVAQTGQPVWVDDIQQEPAWRRDEAGDFHAAAIMFPVVSGGRVVAVFEFFADRPMRPEEPFLWMMTSVGLQLGHVVERRRLQKRITEVSEEEQRRLGRELHDNISQQLTAAGMLAKTIEQRLAEGPEAPRAAELGELLAHVQDEVRTVARGLVPLAINSSGLTGALAELAERTGAYHGVACIFDCPRPVPLDGNAVGGHVYRIAQEAIHNAIRHGEASRIRISLAEADDRESVLLSIDDNGRGFVYENVRHVGMGLELMRHRADLIDADLHVDARPGAGTTITCRLPKE